MPDNFDYSLSPAWDNRTNELVYASHSQGVRLKTPHRLTSDPQRSSQLENNQHPMRPARQTGMIVYSVPYSNHFRVQLDGTGATIPCTMAGTDTTMPIGPRATGVAPPFNSCIVEMLPGRTTGIITGLFPQPQNDPTQACPDFLIQGGQSGVQREDVYTSMIQNTYREGGITHFGSNRPLDATIYDWGKITETGLSINIDPWMAFMRVNEICGLWVHYWDDYMRLAGWNMDFQTAVFEITARLDEGENRYIESHNVYPWETLGAYSPGTDVTDTNTAVDVQFNIAYAAIDLPEDGEDTQPISRYQEFGGYLGQGHRRTVMAPAKDSGIRYYADDATQNPDFGVFEEFIGLDGTYGVRSAKQMLWTKYCLIPIAKEMRKPEDQMTGDDGRKENYRFSGVGSAGDPHKVGDVATGGDSQNLQQIAGVYDLLAYAFNWQSLHPFHYHKLDFSVPQESDMANKGGPEIAHDILDFGQLTGQMYMDYPTPRQVTVDSRYGAVDYFSRVAYQALLPDGSIVWGDGYGAELWMSGGSIRVTCPGDFLVTPGRNFTVMAGCDINLRSHNSVDITAGTKDLRLKAQKNMQMVAVDGGLLLESQAEGLATDFQNLVGEDVNSGGVLIKSANAGVATWAGTIYMRTGGDNLAAGPIIFDADKGSGEIILNGDVTAFCQAEFDIWIGGDSTQASFIFSSDGAVIDQSLTVGGETAIGGETIINGAVAALGPFVAVNNSGGFVGQISQDKFAQSFQTVSQDLSAVTNAGDAAYQETFTNGLYASGALGDDTNISQIAFSFRDDGDGTQYHAEDFQLLESRWQALARMGLGTGGMPWNDEPTLLYQDQAQLPYPGKANWMDNATLLQLSALNMFDASSGLAEDRPGPYESPALDSLTKVTPSSGFSVITS